MRSLWRFIVHGAVWIALVGCTSSFDRDWNQYVPTSSEDPLVGRWKGGWRSSRTQHKGELRCILSREAEGRYAARYHATYGDWWTHEFEYTVYMTANLDKGVWKLEGKEDLGWMAGGVYHYRGTIQGDSFESLYSSEEDRGAFQLTRFDGEESPPP